MWTLLILLGLWCVVAAVVSYRVVACPQKAAGATDSRKNGFERYTRRIGTAVESAAHAVAKLTDVLESAPPVASACLDAVPDEVLDTLDSRLADVLKANIELQARLASAEAVIRAQQADIAEAQRQAATDPLTGLPNRRALERLLRAALCQTTQGEGRLYLLMMDLDRFKQINDTLGHCVGDCVLIAVAAAMQRVIEARGGTVTRCGGEEFTALLPCAHREELAEFTHNLLNEVSIDGTASLNAQRTVTSSVGVAGWDGMESADDLAARADKALYDAKWHGRNCAYYHNGRRVEPLSLDRDAVPPVGVPPEGALDERRRAQRYPLNSIQRVAFLTGTGPFDDLELHDVRFVDVSMKGAAFLAPAQPPTSSVLIALSAGDGPLLLTRVVACQRAGDDLWRVACCFVRRVQPDEPLAERMLGAQGQLLTASLT